MKNALTVYNPNSSTAIDPWDVEPDEIAWYYASVDLWCRALRQRAPGCGFWCGYVGVKAGHRLYGVHYDDINADVHGGLTYSGYLDEIGVDRRWWIGFDCAHAGDLMPFSTFGFDGDEYKNTQFVMHQCISLAHQIHQLAITE